MDGKEHWPLVNGSGDTQTPEHDSTYDDSFGPIIGTFTPTAVPADYPPDVQQALKGVALPVRRNTRDVIMTARVVLVSANETVEVLARSGTPTPVLEYWNSRSIDDDLATIAFALEEGDLNPATIAFALEEGDLNPR
jgi:hypothetical protein